MPNRGLSCASDPDESVAQVASPQHSCDQKVALAHCALITIQNVLLPYFLSCLLSASPSSWALNTHVVHRMTIHPSQSLLALLFWYMALGSHLIGFWL